MKHFRIIFFLLALLAQTQKGQSEDFFLYDAPDETVQATLLDNPLFYDAGIAAATNGLWIAWLEFEPKKGDTLWLGLRSADGKWIEKKQISSAPGDYANPTVTIDKEGKVWLTYEEAYGENWNVYALSQENGKLSEAIEVGNSAGPDINHRVALHPEGGIQIVWQSDSAGTFVVETARISGQNIKRPFLFHPKRGWKPSVTVISPDLVYFLWDDYSDGNYNLMYQVAGSDFNSPAKQLTFSPSFEANAQIASTKNGKNFVLWEEDGENWGKKYLARTPGDKKSTRMIDNEGPLHRFRKLHFAELDRKNNEMKEYELPQPSFDLANKRENAPDGFKNFGVFYEHGQLVVDGQNRPWIIYRHAYVPSFGLVPTTHKQDNMRIYARCLLPDGWSKLFCLSDGQGDGMQRISVAALNDGISLAATIGRTDRRKNDMRRGVALAEIHLEKPEVKFPAKTKVVSLYRGEEKKNIPQPRVRPAAEVAGKKYELFFGDLHRHTDISLCFSPADGSIEDAYRYAIDAAPLDFLGITDHTHDLDMGNGLALIWHRSRKEVNRHALAGKFIPFYSYERSRGDTDHNVISLRDDVLRPHTYALTQFWDEIDTNTFTIAHQPFNAITWGYKDDVHRPLLELYQGFRNDAREEEAKQAVLRGNHVGFIATSDHLSTSGSFAGVWTEKPTRESIFRAMQARRTFGATTQMNLKVTCGDHWMGEIFDVKELPPIKIEIKKSAPISNVDLYVDGVIKTGLTDILQSKEGDFAYEFAPDKSLVGAHIFYIRVKLTDGNRAWSSPIWVNVKP